MPMFPSVPDPSEYMRIKAGSLSSSCIAIFFVGAFCVLMPGCHFGVWHTGWMVSMLSGWMLRVSMTRCREEGSFWGQVFAAQRIDSARG